MLCGRSDVASFGVEDDGEVEGFGVCYGAFEDGVADLAVALEAGGLELDDACGFVDVVEDDLCKHGDG